VIEKSKFRGQCFGILLEPKKNFCKFLYSNSKSKTFWQMILRCESGKGLRFSNESIEREKKMKGKTVVNLLNLKMQ